MNDADRLEHLLRALMPEPDAALERLRFGCNQGAPVPKGRPRMTARGRARTPERTRHAEDVAAWEVHSQVGSGTYADGKVAVALVFYMKDERRCDVDNLVKLFLDAATRAAVWSDDSQVAALAAVRGLDRDHPRTVFGLAAYPC